MKRRFFIFGLTLSILCVFSSTDAHTFVDSSYAVSVSNRDHINPDTSITPSPAITPTLTSVKIKPQNDDHPDRE